LRASVRWGEIRREFNSRTAGSFDESLLKSVELLSKKLDFRCDYPRCHSV
jgi:hypothetical protein